MTANHTPKIKLQSLALVDRVRAHLFLVLVFSPLIVGFVGLACCGLMLFMMGQVAGWLKTGVWVALPASYLFTEPPAIAANAGPMIPDWFRCSDCWLANPHDWFGVHKILAGLLNSFSIPGLAILVAFLVLLPLALWLYEWFELEYGVELY